MPDFDAWDVTLLVMAGYIAIVSLVRLMRSHRDKLLGRLRQQMAQEQRRKPKPKAGDAKSARRAA